MARGRHARPSQTTKHLKRVAVGSLAATPALGLYTPAQAAPTPTQIIPQVALPTPVAAPVAPEAQSLVVAAGDTISELAKQRLGLPAWEPFYEENRDVIGADPNLIFPGQTLHYAGGIILPKAPVPTEVVPQAVPEQAEEIAPEVELVEAVINNSAGPVSARTQAAANAVFTYVRGASLISIGGTRGSARDMAGHPSGNALDYMVNSDVALGEAIVAYHVANWDALGVDYVIYRQKIKYSADGAWEAMEDRGSPTQNHMDHPHVNYLP